MKNSVKTIQTIILMGALWGICEASIGYGLHFLPYGFSGMFMFPIGMYFMYNAYKQSDSKNAVLWVGLIAASIKFIDLLLPTRSPMTVINPVTSIILESLVALVFVRVFNNKKVIASSYLVGLSWILLFTLTQALIFRPEAGLYTLPLFQGVLFLLLNAFVSGTIITIYLKNADKITLKISSRKLSFALPVIAILLALSMEYVNSLIF
ncbi:MAG: hypothetical protein DRP93_00350 [Candidatus Neomarinimicrobiota bacterium]|nr:MAG: hypothetical protein DRP93_00350 [Candidatus Neomarinimicrobiota bacterium]